jgi:flagellar protein FliL
MADGAPKKSSKLLALVPILVLTLAAGGGGALIGRQIVAATKAAADKASLGQDGTGKKPGDAAVFTRMTKELTPVVTNLAAPEGSWIRLQTAIVYDKNDAPGMDVLSTRLNEDILAYVRTLTLEQIQGASGLDSLRDDLNERAQLRSDGKVRELLIEMLVVR